MQTLSEIRQMLEQAGLAPQKRFGQNFLIDKNLLAKLLELAQIDASTVVLEVGPGTGTLTEELLNCAGKVVAVEIDRGLAALLGQRLGDRSNFTLVHEDVLAGKHSLSPAVRQALGPKASLVSNLPYNVATPLIAQCLIDSWHVFKGGKAQSLCFFERQTFTVQREVAHRLTVGCGDADYGPVSILVALLSKPTVGPIVPPTSFWPKPTVVSQMLRLDFDTNAAAQVADLDALLGVVNMAFNQRRKQIRSILRRDQQLFGADRLEQALSAADIDLDLRPQAIPPEKFLALANALATA